MRLSLLSFLFFCGCSSSSTATTSGSAPDPIAFTPATSERSFQVIANQGSERIVQGSGSTSTTADNCTSEDVAGCHVLHCGPASEPTPGAALDMGAVTVTSPSLGDKVPVKLEAGYFRLIQSGDFADDEDVLVSGSGGADVPAFDIHVTVPAKFQAKSLGACATGATGCSLSDTSTVVEWTGAAKATVQVSFAPVLDTADKILASCSFDGTPGKGRIPGEVIAKLTHPASYSVSIQAYGTKVVSGKMGVSPMRLKSSGFGSVKIGG